MRQGWIMHKLQIDMHFDLLEYPEAEGRWNSSDRYETLEIFRLQGGVSTGSLAGVCDLGLLCSQ
jgi:hypothetical protein